LGLQAGRRIGYPVNSGGQGKEEKKKKKNWALKFCQSETKRKKKKPTKCLGEITT